MTPKQLTTLQEIYFDICDLIDSGQVYDIALSDMEPYETVLELLEEQKRKLEPFTVEADQ